MIEKLLQIYIANFQAMQKFPWAFLPEFYIYNSCLTLLNYVPLCLTSYHPSQQQMVTLDPLLYAGTQKIKETR